MSDLRECSAAAVRTLQDKLRVDLRSAESVEAAACGFADLLFQAFGDAVVLARVYATVDYRSLPPREHDFVDGLARSAKVIERLAPVTPILSLLGTRGILPAWNDRAASRGHVGIPLASADFVRSIPMLAALLFELGVTPAWIEQRAEGVQVDHLRGGEAAGIFYVEDARTATDAQGRKVIPAQDFVSEHDVQTVFGMGGAWPNGHLAVAIVFVRQRVDRSVVRRLAPLLGVFRAATTALAMRGNTFA
jgi:hypothetical protein